ARREGSYDGGKEGRGASHRYDVRTRDLWVVGWLIATNMPSGRCSADKDPDAAKGARMPEWLDILMKKYVDEYSKAKFGGIDTVGRFACFLAVCISGDVLITAAESRALQTLIHARWVEAFPHARFMRLYKTSCLIFVR